MGVYACVYKLTHVHLHPRHCAEDEPDAQAGTASDISTGGCLPPLPGTAP